MKEFLNKWNSDTVKVKDLLLFLLAYIVTHYVFFAFFFSGFLTGYTWLYQQILKVGFNLRWLNYVPYHSWSPILAAFLHPIFTLTFLLAFIPFVKRIKDIKWTNIEQYKWVRLPVFFAALALAWELSTYDYNYYLDTSQYLDRILLIAFAFLIWRNPLFVMPFLVLSLVYRSQFSYPIGGFPYFDKRLLFDILVLFYTFQVLKIYVKGFTLNFLFIVFCIVGSNYFFAGAGKVLTSPHGYEWVVKNKVENFFMNMHQYGWLSSSSEHVIEICKAFLRKFGFISKFFLVVAELSGIVLLWRRKVAIAALICFILTHAGIFVFGGILFWKWMTIDFVLLYIVIKTKDGEGRTLFNSRNFKLSLFVIAFSFIWFIPYDFNWYDTNATQYMSYEVEDEKGNIYHLDKNSMNPYHQFFQFESFLYLVNNKTLPIRPFGGVKKYKKAQLIRRTAADKMPELIDSIGVNSYDTTKVKAFENFIETFFTNRNKRTEVSFIPAMFPAPNHIYNWETGQVYTGKEKVRKFRAILNLTYFDGEKVIPLKKQVADEITIP